MQKSHLLALAGALALSSSHAFAQAGDGGGGQADRGFGIARGAQAFPRLAQLVLIFAPEIQFIAGGKSGGKIVGRGADRIDRGNDGAAAAGRRGQRIGGDILVRA